MTRTILSIMIATCGGCWTGTATSQRTAPSTTPTTSSNEAADQPNAPTETMETETAPLPAKTTAAAAAAASSEPPAQVPSSEPSAPVATPAVATRPAPTLAERVALAAPPPTVAAAEPAPATAAATTEAATAEMVSPRRSYITAGALYLPIDDGYLATNLGAGKRFLVGPREMRIGARLSYGESPYSQVFMGLVGVMQLHWWGNFGIGYGADLGAVSSSQKMGGGWDGTTFGGTLSGTFRQRFARTEISFDLGMIYAAGEDNPTAPYALVSALLQL